jgi:hypothetical protein
MRVTMLQSTAPAPSRSRATRPLQYRLVPSLKHALTTCRSTPIQIVTVCGSVFGATTVGYLRSTDAHPMHTGIKDERAHQVSIKLAMSNVTSDQLAVWFWGGNGSWCLPPSQNLQSTCWLCFCPMATNLWAFLRR